jgi:hypothetical protein
MQKSYASSSSSKGKGKLPMSPGKSPGKPPGKPPVKLPSKPIYRQLPPIALCKCRERVEGPTISQGERLEWPLLREKIEHVFPRSFNPIMPCEWGHKVTNQDAEGRTWDLYFLEIKECMPAPSYMPLSPAARPLVLIRGETASRMSDALESMMNILDALPYNMKYNPETEKLPVIAEELPMFENTCSMCLLPRKDLRYLPPKPNPQNSVKLNLERMKRG